MRVCEAVPRGCERGVTECLVPWDDALQQGTTGVRVLFSLEECVRGSEKECEECEVLREGA